MSEWFYINQWKENKLQVWVLIDDNGSVASEPMTKREAYERITANPEKKLKIVNKFRLEYSSNTNENSSGETNEIN